MQKLLKIMGSSAICLSVLAVFGVCHADAVRGAATTGRGRNLAQSSRMPTMPILPVSAVGNITISSDVIDPTPIPPSPTPPSPGPEPEPEPEPECPDGGVANSEYGVSDCMNDIMACVNGGGLPNGINSMFNEELRNSIVNGMGLCITQVEHCIKTVRINCQKIYETSSDVWLDFNARKVQPAYYSFVLRQTGLTPTQAKNTCLLLDRNTFGSSFNAVSDTNAVTSEYNKSVGAYNRQGNNSLTKDNPMGASVNNSGIDGNRGHYARWDAERAECLVRVAAYNKDEIITNEWLWGAFGDKSPAEVWQTTGSTFTCNKDLFGFSLMNKTKTAAVVGIGGGTLVGAGIGAWAGHGKSDHFDCSIAENRNKLLKEIKDTNQIGNLNMYLGTNKFNSENNTNKVSGKLSQTMTSISEDQCKAIQELHTKLDDLLAELNRCLAGSNDACYTAVFNEISKIQTSGNVSAGALNSALKNLTASGKPCANKTLQQIYDGAQCNFHAIYVGTGRMCAGPDTDCLTTDEISRDIEILTNIFSNITVLDEGTKGNRLKTTLIGAGIGAGVGGAATAITAFVERNNINCRVGDDLERVSVGKSYTIDRLRDFYVKWALNLPNTLAPTAVVTNCGNWEFTCSTFTDLTECANAQFNYRPGNLTTTQLIPNACKVSGSACIANLTTAHQYGVCLTSLTTVNNCDEWQNECKQIVGSTNCNSAQFHYAPKHAAVSNACTYSSAGKSCKINSSVAGQYLNMATCSMTPTPPSPPVS